MAIVNSSDQVWRKALLPPSATIEQAIKNLDVVAIKIVIVINDMGILKGTISDGDIRRGLLKGLDLNSPISSVVRNNSIVVHPDTDRDTVLLLMRVNKIQQIPVVDDHGRLVGLHLWDEITTSPKRPNLMVIMAGGKGTRLRPHTENCPKPLLPVAGKPMVEHIIERAKLEGFTNFLFAVHYLGHLIEDYFGNGESMGVQIDYLREKSPLGTAGALGLLKPIPTIPFVVTNGDLITDIRYGELLDFHSRHAASATMAVRLYEWQHPFGVVQTQGIEIVGFEEKPIARSYINAGVYALSPEAINQLSPNKHCDMPQLFERLKVQGKLTAAYPMHEPWMDIGRPEDYKGVKDGI